MLGVIYIPLLKINGFEERVCFCTHVLASALLPVLLSTMPLRMKY
jgi:hypothetical protein